MDLIVASGVPSGTTCVTSLSSCSADSENRELKIRLHNSSKSSITISSCGRSIVIGNCSVSFSKQSSHSSSGGTGSSAAMTVLLLLFIHMNLKLLNSDLSLPPLPAKEPTSVVGSAASAAAISSAPRNGGNTSSDNPLTFTLILLHFKELTLIFLSTFLLYT